MPKVEIVGWDEKYHQAFIDLSKEWLEKYVSVEPADLEILYHPQREVLSSDGEIFFALINQEVVGTVAMIKQESTFELAKLAVAPRYKGLKIGEQLMQRCIDYAREKQVDTIILFTNRTLLPAISLYRKLGFEEIPLKSNKYLEADMKMELRLMN